jgi:2-methylcitrate dehydratase PrpD
MAGETRRLAEFASALAYDDIPAPVIAITKACLVDTVAVALVGSSLPWSRGVEDYAHHVGAGSGSTIMSVAFPKVSAPAAALANGTFAHAFEFDNLRQPSIGVHPGSTATVGALAVAEEHAAEAVPSPPPAEAPAAERWKFDGVFTVSLK